MKPSESPKEDSQAPWQGVTIVIWAGELALEACEPLHPPKVPTGVAAPLHPMCQCQDARGWHAHDTCAVTRDQGAAPPVLSCHLITLFCVGKRGFALGKSTILDMSCVSSQHDFSERFTIGPKAGCRSRMQPCAFTASAEEGGTS